MPSYVYRCPVCHVERTVRTTVDLRDEILVLCVNPHCESPDYVQMRRVPTSANFAVKGKYTARNGYSSSE